MILEDSLSSMSDTSINAYAATLSQEHNLNARFLMQMLKIEDQMPIDVLISCLKSFINEHFDDFTWRQDYSIQVTSNGLKIFAWEYEGEMHSTIVNESAYNDLVDLITLKSADVEVDLPTLESRIEALQGNYKERLIYYGILENDAPIIPIPAIDDVNENNARFSSAIWFKEIQKQSILLAGCGGIGSYIAFLLSRMNPASIYLYDDDVVETVNMAGQLYSVSDVGKYKVDAIANKMAQYSLYKSVFAIRERFTSETPPLDIMISGFDNMQARKIFFKSWIDHVSSKPKEERKNCLYIDGRLAAEDLQVFCLRGDDITNIVEYKNTQLFSDEEADEALCSYKQTTYMANLIGSFIVNLFTNFVANKIVDGIRELPYMISYSGDTMKFNMKY